MLALHVASYVCGYHAYGETWMAALGKELCCEQELSNVIDHYVVVVKEDPRETVDQSPKKVSWMCTTEEEKLQLQ